MSKFVRNWLQKRRLSGFLRRANAFFGLRCETMKKKWKKRVDKRVQGNSTCSSVCFTFLCFFWRARWPWPWPHLGTTDGGCEDRSAHRVLGLGGGKNYNIGAHVQRARIEIFAMSEASYWTFVIDCRRPSPLMASAALVGASARPPRLIALTTLLGASERTWDRSAFFKVSDVTFSTPNLGKSPGRWLIMSCDIIYMLVYITPFTNMVAFFWGLGCGNKKDALTWISSRFWSGV